MIIPPAYTSYLKRNNGRGYWKLTKKHEPDLSLFPDIISNVVKLLPRFKVKKYEPKNYDSEVSAENDTDDDSEMSPESEDSEHDGEGLSLQNISNLVNHPLTKLVEQVIKKPDDSLRCLNEEIKKQPVVPSIKGAMAY